MNYLVVWNDLKSAIEQAHSVIDLKSIRDRGGGPSLRRKARR